MTTPFEADAVEGCGPYCSPGPRGGAYALDEIAPEKPLFAAAFAPPPPPYPQPKNGGNGRCGPPVCTAGALGCGVPNATAKAHSLDPTAPGCGPATNAVTHLNERAAAVMKKRQVPTLDLNALVHSHCGASYSNCSLCDDETKYMGVRCGYHYAPAGVSILANAVADSFKSLLLGAA